jgi:hypothetical protein
MAVAVGGSTSALAVGVGAGVCVGATVGAGTAMGVGSVDPHAISKLSATAVTKSVPRRLSIEIIMNSPVSQRALKQLCSGAILG